MTRKICKKTPPPHQPLHNICIYSAFLATDREIYLENSYVPGPRAAVSAAKLQYWATSHRQNTQQTALQSRGDSTDCKAQQPGFPSLRTPAASHLFKVSYLHFGERQSFIVLHCLESLANLELCNLIKYGFINPKHPPAPVS